MTKNGYIVVNHFLDIIKIICEESCEPTHTINRNNMLERVKHIIVLLFQDAFLIVCHITKNELKRGEYIMEIRFSEDDVLIIQSQMTKRKKSEDRMNVFSVEIKNFKNLA